MGFTVIRSMTYPSMVEYQEFTCLSFTRLYVTKWTPVTLYIEY